MDKHRHWQATLGVNAAQIGLYNMMAKAQRARNARRRGVASALACLDPNIAELSSLVCVGALAECGAAGVRVRGRGAAAPLPRHAAEISTVVVAPPLGA